MRAGQRAKRQAGGNGSMPEPTDEMQAMKSNRNLGLKLILFGKGVLRNTANALPGPHGQIGE